MMEDQLKIYPTLVHTDHISLAQEHEHHYDESDLERAAKLICQLDDCIIPLIVMNKGTVDAWNTKYYTLIAGRFAWEAAKRARQLNPRCTTVHAFVVDDTNLAAVMAQVEFFFSPSLNLDGKGATAYGTVPWL